MRRGFDNLPAMAEENNQFPVKRVVHSNLDRIGDLPDNVIEIILMHLPIRDAARTTILSKAWRHRWANVPQLIFDHSFLGSLSQRAGKQNPNKESLMLRICEILLLHLGPIDKFALSIPGLKSCPEIDRLILFLSRKGIQDLALLVSEGEFHTLSSYFFSCSQLRCLRLCRCIINSAPQFETFVMLVTIDFRNVYFASNVFKEFISNCPMLEKLILDSCTGVSCLEINAPNLKFLSYNGGYESICFQEMPSLTELSIIESSGAEIVDKKRNIADMIQIFNTVPALQHLTVNYFFLAGVCNVPRMLQPGLSQLRFLELRRICLGELTEVTSTLCLIRSSLNLQTLWITMSDILGVDDTDAYLQLLEFQNDTSFSFNQLREVKLEVFRGTRNEMMFVKLMLAKSSALKTMRIFPYIELVANKQLNILKKMIRLQRTTKAKIIYA